MRVVSMVMDWRYDEWAKKYRPPAPPYQAPSVPLPTLEEIQEFRDLLNRACEYDRKNNEPDCELEDKRQRLRDLAKELGIDISFV